MLGACLDLDFVCMHKNFSVARAFIPYVTKALYKRICYGAFSVKLRHVVDTLVPKKFLCMQKCFFFLPKRIWGHSDLYFMQSTYESETYFGHISNSSVQ